ncbi:hypothetical protein EDS67_04750 [candidate division KSB1 bacterium]|nr:MAG: hypothetical protein EDS67_04750 [candidate division KSB1 bacterium]MBC6948739.1 hypothetical protein [candidate division KSB1 bacterium]MCE7940582.1 hypothetical protein [Chlorobi bacterium CHB1]
MVHLNRFLKLAMEFAVTIRSVFPQTMNRSETDELMTPTFEMGFTVSGVGVFSLKGIDMIAHVIQKMGW